MCAEDIVDIIVECGAVSALVKHLQVPAVVREGDSDLRPYEHEVEKGSAFALGLLAVKVIRVHCLILLVYAFWVNKNLNMFLSCDINFFDINLLLWQLSYFCDFCLFVVELFWNCDSYQL